MGQQSHPELMKAKMLSRKVAASENVSAPPLSRLKNATRFVFAAIWLRVELFGARVSRYVRGKSVCPCCCGHKQQLTHVVHDEFEMRDCRLCAGTGEVTWREIESYKWGCALQRYRLRRGMSLAQMYYETGGLRPDHVERLERGLVRLDEWPDHAYQLADLQLDREAAGHVSTT